MARTTWEYFGYCPQVVMDTMELLDRYPTLPEAALLHTWQRRCGIFTNLDAPWVTPAVIKMCVDIGHRCPPSKQPSLWSYLQGLPSAVEPLTWLLAESVFGIPGGTDTYVTEDLGKACVAVSMAMHSLPHKPVPTGPQLSLCEVIFRNIKTVSGDVLKERYPNRVLNCTGWEIQHVPWRVIHDRMIYLNP